MTALKNPGVRAALASALLFGAAAPASKAILGEVDPWLLAGILYCGSGVGLLAWRRIRRAAPVRLPRGDLLPLAGAIGFGGIVGPVLMMLGLAHMPASGASLLLNLEAVCTALLAWFVFRENVDRRIAIGMALIVAGAAVLSAQQGVSGAALVPSLAVVGACLAWGVDNNLTRKVAEVDATWLAAVKGVVAGPVNLVLALLLGARWPSPTVTAVALVIGFFCYGVSLVLFIVALRYLGTARAGAYYSVAPFFGAVLAVALGDRLTWQLAVAGALIAGGVWLHLAERHEHPHTHQALSHEHWHTHDEHHQHAHPVPVAPGTRHRHPHEHEVLTHTHPHYPDSHHRHSHHDTH
jgi:drug/metabolite transporter (DMT)-like permease